MITQSIKTLNPKNQRVNLGIDGEGHITLQSTGVIDASKKLKEIDPNLIDRYQRWGVLPN